MRYINFKLPVDSLPDYNEANLGLNDGHNYTLDCTAKFTETLHEFTLTDVQFEDPFAGTTTGTDLSQTDYDVLEAAARDAYLEAQVDGLDSELSYHDEERYLETDYKFKGGF